jgi:hypothetical protein
MQIISFSAGSENISPFLARLTRITIDTLVTLRKEENLTKQKRAEINSEVIQHLSLPFQVKA